jgi:hypothetical protein
MYLFQSRDEIIFIMAENAIMMNHVKAFKDADAKGMEVGRAVLIVEGVGYESVGRFHGVTSFVIWYTHYSIEDEESQ